MPTFPDTLTTTVAASAVVDGFLGVALFLLAFHTATHRPHTARYRPLVMKSVAASAAGWLCGGMPLLFTNPVIAATMAAIGLAVIGYGYHLHATWHPAARPGLGFLLGPDGKPYAVRFYHLSQDELYQHVAETARAVAARAAYMDRLARPRPGPYGNLYSPFDQNRGHRYPADFHQQLDPPAAPPVWLSEED